MPSRKRRGPSPVAALMMAAALPAAGQSPVLPPNTPNSNIFNPNTAPIIVVRVNGHRLALVPQTGDGSTSVSGKSLDQKGITSFTQAVATSTPGVAEAPNGEIHVRGSHGQYTYYLDGAPLPANVGGSFSDLINPKDIENLRIFDGGFPAEYGGQVAAVFDVTTRGGYGRPNGLVQEQAQGESTYNTTGELGGSNKAFSYFFSGVEHSSNFYLSPLTPTPLHDAGQDEVGFGKFVYQLKKTDRLTLDVSDGGADIQVPNTPDRQAVGQNDIQKENTSFANLILKHGIGLDATTIALYSHQSQLRYFGSPQDLAVGAKGSPPGPGSIPGSPPNSPPALDETFENQTGNYIGLRIDKPQRISSRDRLQYGIDVDSANGHQYFTDTGTDVLSEHSSFNGGDRSAYIQDDWTPGRFLINYGARYDIHQADITTSQLSPRFNATYHVDKRDSAHAYYDRLFQPIPTEDIKKLNAAQFEAFQPERDDFVETGWEHQQGGATISADGYYRAEKNTVDDSTFANTQIDIPENFAKGYTRGLEAAVDGPLSKTTSYYVNFAKSWAKEAGPVSGGLFGEAPDSYFYDDHDQTNTASFGVSYNGKSTYANLDGEYGSGFPYGEIDKVGPDGKPILDAYGNPYPTALDYIRTEPHLTLDTTIGAHKGPFDLAFLVNNIFNDAYIVKYASAFSQTEWAQGRSYGVKLTANF